MPKPYGTPDQWLLYAKSDLAMAGIERFPNVLLDTLCFHAQQTVEKSIKAVLILYKIDFPYTHDIRFLITQIKKLEIPWMDELDRAVILSKYAWMARYPSDIVTTKIENYQEAVDLAKKVFDWANHIIQSAQKNQGEASS